jgi:peptide-methionine (S)-S-oxide reductase
MDTKNQITLGGGCFWCLETIFLDLQGITKVESGYAGGTKDRPTYYEVCDGRTGHAEVVQITFEPAIITLQEILEIFFTIHDPTTLNRQGNDVGTQYRSIILYTNEEQKLLAQKVLKESSALYENPIVTEITQLKTYYPAEDYHQNYYAKNPNQGYCRVVVAPKVAKFRKKYYDKLKKKEELIKQ